MKSTLLIMIFVVAFISVNAQRPDTTRKTVVVTSAFKPYVKPAAKINFSATTPITDTSAPKLQYNIPSQNLFFTYQPATLKPLAISIDTTANWQNNNYIKAGFGNYSTPFLQAGLSFGDNKGSVLNVHTKHISSKGKLPFQQYSHSMADVTGIFNSSSGNNEITGTIGFDNKTQYYYGYRPDSLKFTKDQLKQRFTTLHGNVGLRNKVENEYGISYNPTLSLNLYGDSHSGRETNLVLNAPLTKTFGKAYAINLGFTADISSFKRGNGQTIKNNLYYLTPAIVLKTPNLIFNAGFTPSWDNQVFNFLPNFTASAKLNEERFVLQAGWVGYYEKNTYQSLTGINPWLQQPASLLNTRIKEQYAGVKGSLGDHFTYNGKVSILNYSNAALFVNDSLDGKTFLTIYEPSMKGVRLHGEVGYTVQEKFSLLAGTNITDYTGLKNNEKAWGLLPLEITAALRWQVVKDLTFKSDFFFWDGSQYRNQVKQSRKQKPGVDLSTGVEFKVAPKINLWVQFNNMFNNRYQRWNQYEVLGFNVLGGIVYSFDQAGK